MKAYGIAAKTGSSGGRRCGVHGDNCICKAKRVNHKAGRRIAKKIVVEQVMGG